MLFLLLLEDPVHFDRSGSSTLRLENRHAMEQDVLVSANVLSVISVGVPPANRIGHFKILPELLQVRE